MDSRVLRVDAPKNLWYDVDFPEVIAERARYYTTNERYQTIACDVRDTAWLEGIPQLECAIVVMEGVSMYLTTAQLQALTAAMSKRFKRIVLLMDCYTPLAAKLSKYKNPVKDVGVNKVYGLENPKLLEGDGLTFSKECAMTPKSFIDQLCGIEKCIFKRLYAGGLSKKLYKLYAYEKE
jgi:hypothetical protein